MTTREHNSLHRPGSSKNKRSGNSKKVHVYQAHLPGPFSPFCKVGFVFSHRNISDILDFQEGMHLQSQRSSGVNT